MEKLFENPILLKIQDFGQSLGQNKFLNSLQGGMMGNMGVIMVGAISQILCALGPMLGLFEMEDAIYNAIYLPYHFTMNSISLWIVGLVAYQYARQLKMSSPIMSAFQSLICFLLIASPVTMNENGSFMMDMSYMGAQGMFIGFLTVFVSIRLEKMCIDRHIRIKMPDACPPFLQDGFTAILPLLFNIILFEATNMMVLSLINHMYNICSGFMALLSAPLGALTSVPGMFVLCTFAAILWCFGIHGTMIIMSVLTPLIIQAASDNALAYQQGGVEALVFYPVALFDASLCCGGTGNTLPLALFGLRSKSKQIRAVSAVSAIPGWFGINEPLTFGMPIMYNPILCIPYVLNIPVTMFLTYLAYQAGFLIPAFVPVVALLPMGFAQYLGTLHWKNAIWDYVMLLPSAIIWYPFFKLYERQLLKKEQETQNE